MHKKNGFTRPTHASRRYLFLLSPLFAFGALSARAFYIKPPQQLLSTEMLKKIVSSSNIYILISIFDFMSLYWYSCVLH